MAIVGRARRASPAVTMAAIVVERLRARRHTRDPIVDALGLVAVVRRRGCGHAGEQAGKTDRFEFRDLCVHLCHPHPI